MSLNPDQMKALRTQAHALKPIVLLGKKGLTDEVLSEIDLGLSTHELIKIKLVEPDKIKRHEQIQSILNATQAVLIQTVGKVCVLYRPGPEAPDA